MRASGVRLKIRSLSFAIATLAVVLACLRPGSRVDVSSREQAVEIATALVTQDDPSFRPEKHKAKVYQECSTSPLVVDLHSEMDTYVVRRVRFTSRGTIEGPWTFGSDQHVQSSRSGPGMYVLDRAGKVIGMAPYVFDSDGEVVGLASMGPISSPSPQLPSGAIGRP
jgi:hypothetical protein